MKRLTSRNEQGDLMLLGKQVYAGDYYEAVSALEEYEDAEEKGLLVKLPCKVGDTVYVITECERICKRHDNDYFTGTGAVECPFENDCDFEECDDGNIRIVETEYEACTIEDRGVCHFFVDIHGGFSNDCWGKAAFLTREEAEKAGEKNG